MTYAVVDVETTGLDLATDRIIEIGIVLLSDSLEQSGYFHSLIDPQRSITAQHIHHISSAMVADAPSFALVVERVAKVLDGQIIVAHNAPFDLGFLNAEFARAQAEISIDRANAVCTLDQSRIYCPEGSHSLVGLAARMGIETPVAHRALADALTCTELFRHYHACESRGHRCVDHAVNRHGDVVTPCEWVWARPWHAHTH